MVALAVATPTLLEPRTTPYNATLRELKSIGAAQALFREAGREGDGNLDCGTLAELATARSTGLVDAVLGSGTKGGYLFEATYGALTSEFI